MPPSERFERLVEALTEIMRLSECESAVSAEARTIAETPNNFVYALSNGRVDV